MRSSSPATSTAGMTLKSVAGGYLFQTRDNGHLTKADLKVVTRRSPTPKELDDLLFAFTVCKHVKSNAIVYAKDGQTAGIGAGIDSFYEYALKSYLVFGYAELCAPPHFRTLPFCRPARTLPPATPALHVRPPHPHARLRVFAS